METKEDRENEHDEKDRETMLPASSPSPGSSAFAIMEKSNR
jgi:hypothetical protein